MIRIKKLSEKFLTGIHIKWRNLYDKYTEFYINPNYQDIKDLLKDCNYLRAFLLQDGDIICWNGNLIHSVAWEELKNNNIEVKTYPKRKWVGVIFDEKLELKLAENEKVKEIIFYDKINIQDMKKNLKEKNPKFKLSERGFIDLFKIIDILLESKLQENINTHLISSNDIEYYNNIFLKEIKVKPQKDIPIFFKLYDGQIKNHNHVTCQFETNLPIEYCSLLKGSRDEKRVLWKRNNEWWFGNYPLKDWEELLIDIAENGIKHPIFITIDYGKYPVVNEGNHRIEAANLLFKHNRMDTIPCEIRFFGRAEDNFNDPLWSWNNNFLNDLIDHYYPLGDKVSREIRLDR